VVYDADGTNQGSPIPMLPGEYRIIADRGLEYSIADATVTIDHTTHTATSPAQVTLAIQKVIDTNNELLSGDFHTHATRSWDSSIHYEDKVTTYLAGGVEIMTLTEHDFFGDPSGALARVEGRNPVAQGRMTTIVGSEITELVPYILPTNVPGIVGAPFTTSHWNIWPMTPNENLPRDGVPNDEFLDPSTLFDLLMLRAPRNANVIIQMNHPRSGILLGNTADGYMNNFNILPASELSAIPAPLNELIKNSLDATYVSGSNHFQAYGFLPWIGFPIPAEDAFENFDNNGNPSGTIIASPDQSYFTTMATLMGGLLQPDATASSAFSVFYAQNPPATPSTMPPTELANSFLRTKSLFGRRLPGLPGPDGDSSTITENMDFHTFEVLNPLNNYPVYILSRQDWFSMISQGFFRTGMANTDSHRVSLHSAGFPINQIEGLPGTKVPGPCADLGFINQVNANIKAGKVVGTNCARIRFFASNHMPTDPGDPASVTSGGAVAPIGGALSAQDNYTVDAAGNVTPIADSIPEIFLNIVVEAPTWVPIDEVRIVINGGTPPAPPGPPGTVPPLGLGRTIVFDATPNSITAYGDVTKLRGRTAVYGVLGTDVVKRFSATVALNAPDITPFDSTLSMTDAWIVVEAGFPLGMNFGTGIYESPRNAFYVIPDVANMPPGKTVQRLYLTHPGVCDPLKHPDMANFGAAIDYDILVPGQLPIAFTNPIFVDFVTMPGGGAAPDGKVGPIYPNSTGDAVTVK
jgi:hypothetical protein